MKSILRVALISACLTGISLAQIPVQPNAESPIQNTAVRFSPGTTIRAELAKSVDAKKAKVGDEVIARTLDDFLSDKNELLAPRGSQIVGHVAEVAPHQGNSPSTLGIAFDKMVLKSGTELPLKASIQAIGPPESNATFNEPMAGQAAPGGMPSMSSPGRGAYGGTAPNSGGSMPGSANPTGAPPPDPATGPTRNGPLSPNAQGVVGISGLSLSTGAAQDSLLTSSKHNVKLDGGTQMILHVIP
jgi:hypothetical protein